MMSRRGDGLGFQSDIAKEVLKESNKHCADCRFNGELCETQRLELSYPTFRVELIRCV